VNDSVVATYDSLYVLILVLLYCRLQYCGAVDKMGILYYFGGGLVDLHGLAVIVRSAMVKTG